MSYLSGLARSALALFVLAGGCVGNMGEPGPSSDNPSSNPSNPSDDPKVAFAGECKPQPARLWLLTPTQYTRTVQAMLGDPSQHPGDDLLETLPKKNGFSNADVTLDLSARHVGRLLETAQSIGAAAAGNAKAFPCLAAKSTEQTTCVRDFLRRFGSQAYRRPIQDYEVSGFLAFYQGRRASEGVQSAAALTIANILMSPSFLFRTELGAGDDLTPGKLVALDPYERAQALSYFLTDGPPDADLFAAAGKGLLATKDQIAAHSRRLLATPQGGAGILRLLAEIYGTEKVIGLSKDAKIFPGWSDDLTRDLANEADTFFRQVLWKGDQKLETLLTGDFTMVNERLAAYYGLPGVKGTDFQKVALPATRAGILTSGALMARLSRGSDTLPVQRGRFIRETILCQQLPPPPKTAKAIMSPPPDGIHTLRERLAVHTSTPDCAGCHGNMDPLGFGFENYDAGGRYRDKEVGKTIDASGKLTGARPDGASFANGVDLVRLFAQSPDVSACFVRKSAEYALGRPEVDGCFATAAVQMPKSGGSVIDLMVAMTTDAAFFTRQVPAAPANAASGGELARRSSIAGGVGDPARVPISEEVKP